MITVSWSEALLWGGLLILVELSVHLRFRPIKNQLATIETLLRRDQAQILETVAEHADRIEALETKFEEHLKGS